MNKARLPNSDATNNYVVGYGRLSREMLIK